MSINKVFFSTAAALMMLGACSNEYFIQTEGNMPTKDDIMQVKRGMPQSEVRKIMGSPSVISSLDHRTWIYMNSTMERMAFFEPEELDRNVVAIEFNHDGKVEKVVQLTKETGEISLFPKTKHRLWAAKKPLWKNTSAASDICRFSRPKRTTGCKFIFHCPGKSIDLVSEGIYYLLTMGFPIRLSSCGSFFLF